MRAGTAGSIEAFILQWLLARLGDFFSEGASSRRARDLGLVLAASRPLLGLIICEPVAPRYPMRGLERDHCQL